MPPGRFRLNDRQTQLQPNPWQPVFISALSRNEIPLESGLGVGLDVFTLEEERGEKSRVIEVI